MQKLYNYSTVRQFALKQSIFSESALRWLALNREHNGFDSVFIRIGGKLLIDERAFLDVIKLGKNRVNRNTERSES